MELQRSIRFLVAMAMGLAACVAWAQPPEPPKPKTERRPGTIARPPGHSRTADSRPAGGNSRTSQSNQPGSVVRSPNQPRPAEASPPVGQPRSEPRPATPPGETVSPAHGAKPGPQVELEIVCNGEPWGRIVLELNEERAPLTVENFLRYVDEGFYDGTIFHRVLPDFVIQGGGYVSLNEKKPTELREPVRNESRRGLTNTRGTIAMARQSDPHSALAQFFLNVVNNPQLDFPQAGAHGYTVFGKVTEGMEVVDRIAHVATRVSPEAQRRFERYQAEGLQVERAEQSQPLDPPMIRKARRLDRPESEARLPRRDEPPRLGTIPEPPRPESTPAPPAGAGVQPAEEPAPVPMSEPEPLEPQPEPAPETEPAPPEE